MKNLNKASLPIGFILLGLLTAAMLFSAVLRLAAYNRKSRPPKIVTNEQEQDLYPWATEAMKATYPDTQTQTSTTSQVQRETISQKDLENIVAQEARIRQGSQQVYDEMAADAQKRYSDDKTAQDFYRSTENH